MGDNDMHGARTTPKKMDSKFNTVTFDRSDL